MPNEAVDALKSVDIITHPSREAWLAARVNPEDPAVGGSESSALFRQKDEHGVDKPVNPWKSEYELWSEKLGLISRPASESEALEWGLLLEPFIADRYAAKTGRKVENPGDFTSFRSRDIRSMTCTPDRLVLSDEHEGPGSLSIKCVGAFRAREWLEDAPTHYLIQLQHELSVLDLKWGSFGVLIGGQRFISMDIERNDAFIDTLRARCEKFAQRVRDKDPPEVDGSERTTEALRKLYADTKENLIVTLPSEAIDWTAEIEQINEQQKKLDAREKELKNFLRAAIGSAEFGTLPNGDGGWSWKEGTRAGYVVKPTTTRPLNRRGGK